jgi:copper(I)-binding protein
LGLVIAAILATTVVSACSGAATPAAAVTVSGAWVRATASAAEPSAAYFTITNASAASDTLTAATSPAAGMAQVMQATTSGGMTGMAPMDGLPVAAGSSVTLAPGGLHLMLMDLTGPLTAGSSVELDLMFAHAGHITVQAEVRAN